ncbi:ammonium transporter [Pararhizobium sp. IMCC21322]|uniref:ammonium transporter n=1 Tax=Pararhizobium sp. IMCC21322 TaxID=3067903 RepID=UPI002740FFC9|nr:ammonium transporter [Pararhizobium sp. IMCC21322]
MDAADTAWILTSTALVLLMTLPGLALFYGGLVQSRNILSVLMHCMAIACLASVLWLVVGYSLAFSEGSAWIGGLQKAFLNGVGRDTVYDGTTLPETVFFTFQMTFAIITPALMVGAFVERIKFSAVLIISAAWLLLVYAPVTHWVWGGGWLAERGVMDFAGGIVVHVTAGASAAVIAVMLGARSGFPKTVQPPHAPWMVMVGASLLWVGWFGFNAGSALGANGDAGMAMLVTHMSAATASLVWVVIEWVRFGKPSLVGMVTGTIAGLATVTPASGFVGPMAGMMLGLAGGVVCYIAVDLVKHRWRVDDSLDVLAVHGIGGALGTLLTAFLAGLPGGTGLDGTTIGGQFAVQLLGVGSVLAWSVIATIIIVWITKALVGLRVNEDEELEGLDFSTHGESGYRL